MNLPPRLEALARLVCSILRPAGRAEGRPCAGVAESARGAATFALFALVVAVAAWDFGEETRLPRAQEVAPFDIKSPVDCDVVDTEGTETMRRKAEAAVPPVHRYSPETFERVAERSRAVFAALQKLNAAKAEGKSPTGQAVKAALREAGYPSPEAPEADDLRAALLAAADEKPDAVSEAARFAEKLFVDTLSDRRDRMPGMNYQGVKSDHLGAVKDAANRRIQRTDLPPDLQALLEQVFFSLAVPTSVVDEAETAKRRADVASRIQPVKRHISKGEVIVRSGEIVKPEHVEILLQLDLGETARRPLASSLGAAAVAGAACLLLAAYIQRFRPEGRAGRRELAIAGIALGVTVLLAKGVRFLLLTDATITVLGSTVPVFSPYAVPSVLAPVLIALLVDAPLALFANGTLAVLLHVALRAKGFDVALVTLVTGAVAVMTVRRMSRRGDLTRAGALASFAGVLVIVGLAHMDGNALNPHFRATLARDAAWGFLNGFFSTVLALALLPTLEAAFKTSTPMRLLELADMNHPLLRRLAAEAQGTFHHSIAVGTIAESAAERIGADALLCRVGAFYHDIGKLKRPHYFVENQAAGENVHDTIKPNLSALAIMAHCRDGVEFARAHRITREIQDIIEQHHGTNLLTYFYVKSQTGVSADDLGRREIFRYPGPKPQTREAAIVLLADAVEAATRSVERPTASSLKGTIKKIIQSRFLDGQFDECTLTLRDLSRVQQAFTKTILGMYHKRIEYPSDRKRDKRREARAERRRPVQPAPPPAPAPVAPDPARSLPAAAPAEPARPEAPDA